MIFNLLKSLAIRNISYHVSDKLVTWMFFQQRMFTYAVKPKGFGKLVSKKGVGREI